MPEYDLGTAHGKIKIDVDDRGAKTGERTLQQFNRTVKKFERQLATFESSLTKMEAELKKVAKDFVTGDRAARSYSGGVDKADGSQRKFSKSGASFSSVLSTAGEKLKAAAGQANSFAHAINLSGAQVDTGRKHVKVLNIELSDLVRKLYLAGRAANDFGPAIAGISTVISRLGRSNGMGGFLGSFRNIGVATSGMSLLTKQFLGFNSSMKDVPKWQKSIVNLVGAFSGLAIASKVTDTVINKGFLGRRTKIPEGISESLKKIYQENQKVQDTVRKGIHPWRDLNAAMRLVVGASVPLTKTAAQVERLMSSLRSFGTGAAQTIAGIAIMRGGLKGLADRFAFLAKIPKPIIAGISGIGIALGAITQAGAKGLTFISNVLVGLLSAVKQLAGGFLAIPGAIATAGIAVGVLKIGMLSLKKTFEGVFKAKDTEELAAAIQALPEALRPLARVLSDTKQQFQGVSDVIRDTLINGVEKPIKDLTGQYFPLLAKQGKIVANSLQGVAEAGVDWALQPQTVHDIGLGFLYTSETVNNLKAALTPLLNGLRDVAIVGMAFVRDFTAGGQGVTQQFADWAKKNRESGQLMVWMQNAVQGAKDLLHGIWDLTKGLWSLLTLFAKDDGSNALGRFADAMERFNKAVDDSKASGILKQIGDAVKGVGTDKITEFKDIMRSVGDAIKEVWPVVKQIGSAFQDVFVPAIKVALQIIESFAAALGASGLETYIGWILGMVAAFGLFKAVLGPIRSLIQVFVGFGTAVGGAKKLVSGFVDVLYYFGPAGAKASTALSKLGGAMTAMAGGLAAVAAGFVIIYTQMQENQKYISDFNALLDESKTHMREFKDALREAFKADAGVTGKNVFDTVKDGVETSIADVKAQAEQVPGIWANIRDVFSQPLIGTGGFAEISGGVQGDAFNNLQKLSQDAEHAKVAFDKLGFSSEQLAAKATGTDAEFNGLKDTLSKLPEGSAEAIAVLQKVRDEYQNTQAEFAKAGPGSVALTNGIQQIADAGGDATSKLQGLKTALFGLGLDKTTEYENAIAFAESIRKIGEEAATAADASAPLNDIFGQDGTFNAGTVNGGNLFALLSPAVEQFKQAAVNGKDVGTEFQKLIDQVPALAQGFTEAGGNVDATDANIRRLITTLGGVPDLVSILVSVKDGDKTAAELAAIVAKLETTAAGQEITIPIIAGGDPQKIQDAVKAALGINANVSNNIITIPVGTVVDQAALDKLKAQLSQNGIPLPGSPAALPPPLQVTPQAAPQHELPKPEPKKGDQPAVSVGPTEADQQALTQANQEIADLKTKIDELNATPAKIQLDTANLSEVRQQIVDLQALFNNNELQFTIVAKGYDETVFVLGQVKAAIAELVAAAATIQPALVAAFNTQPVDAFSTRMSALVAEMRGAGALMVSELAAGMLESKHLVDDAGNTIATAVNEYLKGGSPTKKGPLSGRGWTSFSGAKLVNEFAAGMVGAQGAVAGASSSVAGSAGSALQGPYDIGKMLGRLQQLSDFGQHLVDVFSKITDTVLKTVSFISDPMGKGTFFGQSKGAAFGFRRDPGISDADLRKRNEDDLQSKLQQGAKDGTRAGLKDLPGIAGLDSNPSKNEIAAAILGEAGKRGYNTDVGTAAIAAALKESGLDPTQTNATGHESLFQTSADKGVGHDPAAQLKWFFDTMDSLGGPTKANTDPYAFIADNIEKGGYSGSALKNEQGAAAKTYVDAMTSALADSAAGVASLSGVKVVGRDGLKTVTENLLEQVTAAFPQIKDVGGVRADSLPDHPTGHALDLMVGENKALGDQINSFLQGNAKALGIQYTIWQQMIQQAGGDPSLMADRGSATQNHMDHVHVTTSDVSFQNSLIDPNAVNPSSAVHGLGSQPGPNLSDLTPEELKQFNETQGLSLQTQDQMLAELRRGNSSLDTALTAGQADGATTDQQIAALNELQKTIDTTNTDTPGGRSQAQALEGIKSDIMGKGGLAEGANPVDQAATIAGNASQIAGSVFDVINSSIEAFGAAQQIGDTLVRGVSNSEDIYNMVDSVQKFVELAANVAGAVSNITTAVGSIASIGAGADMGASGAISAVGQIAGIVQGALETVNAVIDLGQEVYRIAGTYVGELLGFLAGGGSQLQGDVKFLLDYNDNTLKAYSRDNPLDKRDHPLSPGAGADAAPAIGQVNVYGGPGQDPRETTRNMMFAVTAAGMGAGGLN